MEKFGQNYDTSEAFRSGQSPARTKTERTKAASTAMKKPLAVLEKIYSTKEQTAFQKALEGTTRNESPCGEEPRTK